MKFAEDMKRTRGAAALALGAAFAMPALAQEVLPFPPKPDSATVS